MAKKVWASSYETSSNGMGIDVFVRGFILESGAIFDGLYVQLDPANIGTTLESLNTEATNKILAYANTAPNSWGIVAADILFTSTPYTAWRTYTTPTRALDTAFQVSTVRDTFGLYSVSIASSLTLTGGQDGSVVLEYADNAGMTTNLKTVGTLRNANTGTLTIGINTLQTYGGQIGGIIPAGKYVRLRSVDSTATPVQSYVSSYEVLV